MDISLPTTKDFHKIVMEDIPLIDVRAPIEFKEGAFLNSVNLPLINDHERHVIGTCYKQNGNAEAVKLGHKLVSGEVKEARIAEWIAFMEKHPNAMLYCFRGGMRSRISQQWIFEATGKEITRLNGGYKAFRNYMIKELASENQKNKLVILGGSTGSGKTILLKKLKNTIDLEKIAYHRGSSFGGFIEPQPTQISFENNLASSLIKYRHSGYNHLIMEDEGRHIGRNYLPEQFLEYFTNGELVLLDVPLEQRIEITFDEYVTDSQESYLKYYGENGLAEWSNFIKKSLDKLKKRLGGDRYKSLLEIVEKALQNQIETGNSEMHKQWIEVLLIHYYDKMYNHQIENSTKKVVFRGNYNEVVGYLKGLE